MKLTWITDIHLNFLEKDQRIGFYRTLIVTDGDGVMISGDIAEATSIESILKEMANAIQKPIYFVLGNCVPSGQVFSHVSEMERLKMEIGGKIVKLEKERYGSNTRCKR